MKKFLLILLVMSVGFQGALLAQTKTVTGTVTGGDDGLGIPRANVKVKGTTRGTPTDLDGNYTINVSADETLVFSFIGYTSQEILVGNQTTVNVVLQPDVSELDEIVVVGYGSQEKKEITSSVASVKPEDFNKGNISSPTQLLQGKVAGLQISRPGGDPNAGFNIRLRGLTTFGANSSPLVVLDGVIGADLQNVDPNDIASIDVLKDGSAAAIYGARGSSGVILITTTKGNLGAGTTQVSLNSTVSIDQIANKIDVLSPEEFVSRGGFDFGSQTDWLDELTQTGVSYTTSLSILGAVSGKTSYNASFNYRDNDGIVKGTGNERLNARLGLNHSTFNDRLRFQVNLSNTNTARESINNSAFRYGVIYNPTAPIFDNEDTPRDGGYFQRGLFDFFNPVALINQQEFTSETKTILASFKAEFDITDNLTFSAQYSQDRTNTLSRGFWSIQDVVTGSASQGSAQRNTFDRRVQIFSGVANYSKEINSDLKLDAILGVETQRTRNEGFNVQVSQFLFDSFARDALGGFGAAEGTNTAIWSFKNEDQLNSAFGRVNLNYKGTYFLSASVRAESYSGFGESNKTGYFPALSVGAELTDIFELGPFNSLKARASYGITGNLPPDPTLALSRVFPGGRLDLDLNPLTRNDIFSSLSLSRNSNPQLKWETKKEFNVGFDYALLDNRLTGTVDYYTRNIEDLLFNVSVNRGAPNQFDPGTFNQSDNTWVNLADLRAAGFEFSASYSGIKLGQVSWSPTFNFTLYDKTEIESLSAGDITFADLRFATPGSPGQNNNPIIINQVGNKIGNFTGPRFLGVDESGNAVLSSTNPDEFEIIGNALPDGDFGFANAFNYGKWDLNFFLRGSFGHELYNSFRGFYENRDSGSGDWNSVVTDKTPLITSSPTFSNLYIEDATFIRLDNATLGYSFDLANSNYLDNVRVFFSGQNLFTITNYTGIDPEVRTNDSENGDSFSSSLSPGLERRGTFFTSKTFTLGVSVKFK